MNAENKNLAEKESTSPALRRSEGGPSGFDGIDTQRDMKMPRLLILQGLSEIVQDGKGSVGQIADSISKEIYGDSIEFIPLFVMTSYIKFKPGEGMVLRSMNGVTIDVAKGEYERFLGHNVEEVPHDSNEEVRGIEWNGNEPPSISRVYNFLVLMIRNGEIDQFPISLRLMRTSAPAAKDFITAARRSGENFHAKVYKLTTKKDKNDKGQYAIPSIDNSRRCTDEEYAVADRIFQEFHSKKADIKLDLEEGTPEE